MNFNGNKYWIALIPMCALLSIKSVGQGNSALPTYFNVSSILPTSPDAAMLGRFGEIPVGYYTGTADISIPIYTIEDKEANFSLPIVLQYHSSGVKVTDMASVVGIGWSLEAEGSVIQVVNGKEDTLDHLTTDDAAGYTTLQGGMILGSYSERSSVGTNVWPCGSGNLGAGDSYTSMTDVLSGDGQPDLYEFSFAGYSGRFYVNPVTHQPTLLNTKVPITFSRIGTHTWKAVTMDGNTFTFGILENVTISAPGNNAAGYTCKLSTIQLNDGKQITFGYKSGNYNWWEYTENYHDLYDLGLNPTGEYGVSPFLTNTINGINYLTSITANNVVINFNLANRADIPGNAAERVNSIDIVDAVTKRLTKTFQFYCDYFPYTDTAGSYFGSASSYPLPQFDTAGWRLRLDSVKEIGYSSTGAQISKPAYRFLYDSSNILPLKGSYSCDYWGYYNGRDNLKLTPDLTFMRDVSCSGYTYANVPLNLLNFVSGGNRAPDKTKMATGVLKQITYPTGGYTKFSYEPNSFTNFMYPDQQKINDATNIGSIEDNNLSTDVTSTSHIIPNSGSPVILHLTARITKGINQSVTFDQLQPSYIQVVQVGPGGNPINIINTWQMTDTSPFEDSISTYGYYTWQTDMELPYDSGYYYVLSVSLPDALGPQGSPNNNAEVDCIYSYYLLPMAERAVSYGGGIRIDTIQNFDETGSLLGTKILSYINSDSTSSGLLMSSLTYLDPRPMTFVENTTTGLDANYIIGTYTINFMTSQSMVPYSDAAGGNPVGYSRVEEISLGPDGSNNGKHVYYFHNTPDRTLIDNPDDPDLLNGYLTREEIWNATKDTLITNTYNYQDNYAMHNQVNPVFNGIKAIPQFYGAGPCNFPGGSVASANDGPNWSTVVYTWVNFYPIVTNWYLLQSKTSNYYYSGTSLSSTESYKYNMLGQLTEKDSHNSKGEPIAAQYIHPYDTTGSQATLMNGAGLLNDVLEERDWVNGALMAKTDIVYGTQGTQVVRDSIVRTINGNSPYTDVLFNQYGSYKTATQFAKRNKTSSVIWDYHNELPIAEVSNAIQSDIAYTSFEADGSGNWSIPDTARNRDTAALTGNLSFDLIGTNSISRSGLNSSNTYIVGFGGYTGNAVKVNGNSATAKIVLGNWTYYEAQVTGTTSVTISGTGTIDELRLYPKGALMNTFTYSPLFGITSHCDASAKPSYYSYDGLGRLQDIVDQYGNILKHYDYEYQVINQ